jgi:tRNA U38,U39,U40 pseudouridine synthase TruA
MIDVRHLTGEEWLVSIKSAVVTHHRVRVTTAALAHFAHGRSPEELLEESFQFLLERESNTSILPSFDLPLIARHFPEYETEICARLKRD